MVDRLRQFTTGRGLVFVPWLVLAAGNLFADALQERDPTFRTAVSVGLWVAWAVVLVVIVVPGAAALVLARTAVPAAVPAALWALQAVGDDRDRWHVAISVASGLAALAVLLPQVGERFVDSAGYGDERRFILRPPALVQTLLIPLTWAATVAGLTAGPLLLADERWAAGAVTTVVGAAVALVGLRAQHRMARRWLVLVPAGLVVHDPGVIEPTLVPTTSIRVIGPAPADTTASDLTGQALGLALQVDLSRPVEVAMPTRSGPAEARAISRFLVTPTRPAAVLTEASRRRIPIG